MAGGEPRPYITRAHKKCLKLSNQAVALATGTRRRMRYAEWLDLEVAKGIKRNPSLNAMGFYIIIIFKRGKTLFCKKHFLSFPALCGSDFFYSP